MESRKLTFPLDRTFNLDAFTDVGIEGALNFPDENTKIPILFQLSFCEYLLLSSAIDVGSDIAYPEKSTLVQWLWMSRGMTNICEQVIECIVDNLDNPTFMNALNGALQGFPALPTPEYPYLPLSKDRPLPTTVRENGIPVPSCDLDALWGACVSTVDNISLLVLDFLESLDSADSDATRIAKVVDAIPVVGALADEITVTDVAEFAVLLVDEFKDGFVSGDSLPLRQEISCALFCLCREKCSITFDDVFTAFTSVADVDIDITTTVIALMAKFNLNLFSDQQIYVGLCCLGITALATGNYFFGLFGGDTFNKSIIEEGFDEPSSDWELYCTDCAPEAIIGISATNGSPTLSIDGSGLYTLTMTSNSFASLRLLSGDGTCPFAFTLTDMTIVTGTPTGRSWLNCPSGTTTSGNASILDAEGVLLSTVSFSTVPGIGGTAFTVTFKVALT